MVSFSVVLTEKGDAFLVKNEHDFAMKVLPQYFRHKNFSSFVRQVKRAHGTQTHGCSLSLVQLNFYGFRKRTQSTFCQFKHKFFKQNQPELLRKIKRHGSKTSCWFARFTVSSSFARSRSPCSCSRCAAACLPLEAGIKEDVKTLQTQVAEIKKQFDGERFNSSVVTV